MNLSSSESNNINDKIRQQYDFLPYPESDIEFSPKNDLPNLFHNLLTMTLGSIKDLGECKSLRT